MTGQYFINGKDCYTTWGVTFNVGTLEALLKPPAAKPYTRNTSRSIAGDLVDVKDPQPEARKISLSIGIKGTSLSNYVQRQEAFLHELTLGEFELYAAILGKTYTLVYSDCTLKIANYADSFGSFRLEVEEPEPNGF